LSSPGHSRHRPDLIWAIAFAAPYAAVFLAFAAYPITYALWLGSKPSLYADLIADPHYLPTLLTNAALLTYAIPASFLIFPFYRIVHGYGLANNLWGVIAAHVTFATPFAILILGHYARLLPLKLDDAARIDGASPAQIYLRIYLPLITPALAVVAIWALLFAWNDYLYQSVLLSSARNMTVAMTQAHLFEDTDAPWKAMMAAAILYALPPIGILFALRRKIAAGLTLAE